MGSAWASIVCRKGIAWDTDIICARGAHDTGCLTNTVAVCAVIAGNGAVFQTRALVAGTTDAVRAPGVSTRCEVSLAGASHATRCHALVTAINLKNFMGSTWTGVVCGERVCWNADKICGWVTNDAGCLTNAVAVGAIVALNRAIFQARSLVASTVDGIAAPGEAAAVQVT